MNSPNLLELSPLLQLQSAFLFGLLSSFTPCVYPLIPITLALFGAQEDLSRGKAFLLSSTYVLGIATTYTSLGLIAALSGNIFGSFLGNPLVILGIALLLVLLSLYTLDIFSFSSVHALQTRASKVGGRGYRGAFLMGCVSGVVAAPCVGPALVVILTIVAKQREVLWGATLLGVYSLGLGLIFIVLGTFSGLLNKLPKSGNWMHAIKFLIAVALLLTALFFLQPLLPLSRFTSLLDIPLLIAAILLVGLCTAIYSYIKPLRTLRSVSAVVISAVLFPILIPLSPTQPSDLAASESVGETTLIWHSDYYETLKEAKRSGEMAMIDFSAEWCAACKELDALTFSDPRVMAELSKMTIGKIDFTVPTPELDEIADKHGIMGLPCILFFRSDGTEIPDSKLLSFVTAEEFLGHLDAVKRAASEMTSEQTVALNPVANTKTS